MKRRDIENAVSDDLEKFVTPIISSEGINHFIACSIEHFKEVSRYMWPCSNMDFEILTSLDYSLVTSNNNLRELLKIIVSNDNQYRDEELIYLLLRMMIVPIWKLDVFLLTHLHKCAEINAKWSLTINYLANGHLEGNYYCLTNMPYWLRNEHIHLLHNLPPQCDIDKLHSVELAMLKSNNIQAVCKTLGNSKMIFLDYGLYVYLAEWCKLILSGYRLRKYCEENDYSLTEPIKTGASLIIAITDILANKQSVFFMPPSIMLFDKNDPLIIKEIVSHQIDFILAHEYGHIILNHHSENPDNEIAADLFSVSWIRCLEGKVLSVGNGGANTDDANSNDIQSINDLDRKIESIEILFVFFELFYYISKKRNNIVTFGDTHPQIRERRNKIRENHGYQGNSQLIKYTDELFEYIKCYIDSLQY